MSSALHRRQLLSCLIAALLVVGAIPAATVTATATGTPTGTSATAAPSPPVSFVGTIMGDERGDVAEIGVRFFDAEVATVRIGSSAAPVATVVVRDRDGDGRATLRLDTYDGAVGASDGDAVTVHEHSNVTSPLATESYDLTLWIGNGTDGERWDVGILAVRQRSTDSLRTWVAPKSADPSNLSAIRRAKASGNLTRSSVVAKNDTLVFELRASGLEGAVVARNGSNATTRFFEFFENESASFVVRETAPLTSQEAAYLDVLDPSAATVVADARNDSYYLVADLEDVSMTDGHGGTPANNRNRMGEYRANVTLSNRSALADERESVVADFGVRDRRVHVETVTDEVFVRPAANQPIFGVTTLAPGSRLTVDVRGEDGELDQTKTVRVRNRTGSGGGVFTAAFDFSDVPEGTSFTVTVETLGNSTLPYRNDSAEGTVVAATASVSVNDRGLTEHGVMVENATFSHGGYVALHRGSPDGEVLGRSEQIGPDDRYDRFVGFESPLESNATVVAVAHRNGPGDSLGEPYTENGTVVADSVQYATTPETTRTTTETTTGTPTVRTTDATDGPTATTTPPTRTTGPGGDGTVPGFGVLAALAALAVGLGACRKKERR